MSHAAPAPRPSFPYWALAAVVLIYQSVNSHHYMVDAIIWRG
jgi:hypothetical protein